MSEAILPTQIPEQEDRRTKEWTPARVIYVFLVAVSLFSHFWLLVSHTGINMPANLWIPRIAAGLMAVWLGKLWQDKGFRILAVYTLLFFLRAFIPNPANVYTDEISESVFSAVWLFAGCYGMARVLNERQLKRTLLSFSIIWLIGMSFLCCLGIDAAWTGKIYNVLDRGFINLNGARLNLFFVPTTSAAIMGISILAGTITLLSIRKKAGRILILLLLLPIILTLSLTDSRATYISVSAGMGTIVFSEIMRYNRIRKNKLRAGWKTWALSIFAMIVVTVVLIFTIIQITVLFNRVKMIGIIPRALAEGEIEKIYIRTRGFAGYHVLTGRAELWQSILEYIGRNKMVLLIGESKIQPLSNFDNFYGHCHNIFFQVLVESGIPGLILFLWFIVYIIKKALKAIRTPDIPRWIYLMTAVPVALLAGDVAECFAWLRASCYPMIAVLFIAAGVLSARSTAKGSPLSIESSK